MTAPGIRDGNKAVAYIRVSTDEQSASITAQREAIAAIAKARNLQLVAEYVDEGVSGAKAIAQRPALRIALKALADNEADRLVVSKLDRLARNARVALEIAEDYAHPNGWAMVLGDLDIDTGTAIGKMQLTMFAGVARFERDRISERTREALAVKRAEGVQLGRRPKLPDEVVARIVSERNAGRSYRAIACGLNADEVPTAHKGKAWYASVVAKVLAGQQAANLLSSAQVTA
ncbi:hypothetical protein A5712_10085 [Mycobacterium sp. E2327]|uniref:recombinase family protein n=1 Tax=Mycobacterium sp. E2327 TaxID=1834132 RepID=UPI0008009534|nr:recombinase family protein [Mycobacterium sp. E2327]OBI11150.1 hypothetical protein A5712_10085 [Mycobacterium sp. E2327]